MTSKNLRGSTKELRLTLALAKGPTRYGMTSILVGITLPICDISIKAKTGIK